MDGLIGEHRLVTVLGMGGAGKTALAIRWAHERAGTAFPGGIWFCELAPAREPGDALSAIAAGLAVELDARVGLGQAADRLAAALDARGAALVILDNAEHLELSAWVERWLGRTQDVRFLVTSRERLQLQDEAVLLLDPLDDADGTTLFVDRARAARGPDAVGVDDDAAVLAIVRGLDGLPLAIEIAASRVATMSPGQLAARLESRFRLVTAPAGSRPERHSSLRAALDWSWGLLDAWERRALAVASVFRGGFTLEAVEEALGLDDPAAPWPLDLLQSLVDKSLVRVDSGSGTRGLRYHLLESVRAYGAERLVDLPEANDVRARHAAYYIREGEALATRVEGPGGAELLDRLAAERGNLTAAWLQAPEPVERVRAGLLLRVVLDHRGPFDGFRELLDAMVETAAQAPPELRARTLVARARFHGAHRGALAEQDLDAALQAVEALGTTGRSVRAMALHSQASLRAQRSRYQEAEQLYRQAMELHEATGERAAAGRDAVGLAFALSRRGQHDDAERTYQRALAAFRRSGDRWGVGLVLANLAGLVEARGRHDPADAHALEAIAILDEVGDRANCARVHGQLGRRLTWRKRLVDAESHLRRALLLQQQIGDRRWEGVVLGDLADLLVIRDRLAEAEALLLDATSTARAMDDAVLEARLVTALGVLRQLEGSPWEAEAHLEDGVAAARRADAPAHLAEALVALGVVRGLQRRPDDANAALDEASALATMASLEHTAELIAVVRDALGAWSGRAGDVVAMRATLAAIPFAHPVVSVLTEALVDA